MSNVETSAVQSLLNNLQSLTHSFTTELKDNLIAQTLNESLEEIIKRGEIEKNEAVSELEQAKLLNLNAYVLVSLYFTHLKLKGDKLDSNSPIVSEINRVKTFMDKVKIAETQLSQKEGNVVDQIEGTKDFIEKHYSNNNGRAPAVSKVHFEPKDEASKTGTHFRFDGKEEQKQMEKSLKATRTKKVYTKPASKIKKTTSKQKKNRK
ncbi:hypothetical protein CANINC_004028 [Pichia inconspicua]|uniref:Exosome complex protein n=1 Tax=Pichia inconspicua TaxID=52247 RepID=A0A4T0WX50_9ASCO|nr:hypothetical protein CANINC_004028 [[Candida] inconspicua]